MPGSEEHVQLNYYSQAAIPAGGRYNNFAAEVYIYRGSNGNFPEVTGHNTEEAILSAGRNKIIIRSLGIKGAELRINNGDPQQLAPGDQRPLYPACNGEIIGDEKQKIIVAWCG